MSFRSLKNSKKRRTVKNVLQESRNKEIPMPSELMEQLFDETTKIGYESEEELEYKNSKKEYNSEIYKKIKKVIFGKRSRYKDSPYGALAFTERQKEVFELMYIKGFTLSQVATYLNITSGGVGKIRSQIFEKIKKLVAYEFRFEDNSSV